MRFKARAADGNVLHGSIPLRDAQPSEDPLGEAREITAGRGAIARTSAETTVGSGSGACAFYLSPASLGPAAATATAAPAIGSTEHAHGFPIPMISSPTPHETPPTEKS